MHRRGMCSIGGLGGTSRVDMGGIGDVCKGGALAVDIGGMDGMGGMGGVAGELESIMRASTGECGTQTWVCMGTHAMYECFCSMGDTGVDMGGIGGSGIGSIDGSEVDAFSCSGMGGMGGTEVDTGGMGDNGCTQDVSYKSMHLACTRASGALFELMMANGDAALELECRSDELQIDYGGGRYEVAMQRLRLALDDEYFRDVETSMDMTEVVQGTMCFDDSPSVPVVVPRARGRRTRSASWAPDARMALRFIAIDQVYMDELKR